MPRVVLFSLKADPNPVERLGSFLPDGSLVDLQAAHLSMRGRPSAYLRDCTAFRLGGEGSRAIIQEVLAWVETQRAPGTALPPDKARLLAEVE